MMTALPGEMLDDRVDSSEHSDATILVNKVPFVNMNRRERLRVRETADNTEYETENNHRLLAHCQPF